MESEIWRDIPGYKGLYQVSNFGRVKSVSRYVERCGRKMFVRERVLKPSLAKNGYLIVNLNNQGYETKYIHRLVALLFIPNPNPKEYTCVEHLNTCKTDNRIENLRWCNFIMNNNNPITCRKMSESSKGIKPSKEAIDRLVAKVSKPVEQYDMEWNLIKIWNSVSKAARELGICAQSIFNCCKHPKRWKTAGNYKWKYHGSKEH